MIDKGALHQLVVVDVETTGVNPFQHQLLSVALAPVAHNLPTLEVFVTSKNAVWQEVAAAYFESYRDSWEESAVEPIEACSQISRYLSTHFDSPVSLVGHNIGFDIAFLRQLAFRAGMDELPMVSHRAVDTHTLLYALYVTGRVPQIALSSSGAFSYFGIEVAPSHRHCALGDAIATRQLFHRILDLIDRP